MKEILLKDIFEHQYRQRREFDAGAVLAASTSGKIQAAPWCQ